MGTTSSYAFPKVEPKLGPDATASAEHRKFLWEHIDSPLFEYSLLSRELGEVPFLQNINKLQQVKAETRDAVNAEIKTFQACMASGIQVSAQPVAPQFLLHEG
jgi:hypothetical protein